MDNEVRGSGTTAERTIMAALRNLQGRGALQFETFSDEWVVKYWRDDPTAARYIFGYCNLDLNSQAGAAIALDKVATYALLQHAGVPAVPHILLTSPDKPKADAAQLARLLAEYGPLVIKPTQGSSGREIARCGSIDEITAHIQAGSFPSWCASPLMNLETELRLVVLDCTVLLAYQKQRPATVNGVPMFNLAHGAEATPMLVSELAAPVKAMAANSMRATGLRLAAVDIVTDTAHAEYVLEINSRFSLEYFASMATANRASVIALYETILQTAIRSR